MLNSKLISFDINQAALEELPCAQGLIDKLPEVTVEELEQVGIPMGRAFLEMAIKRKSLEEPLKSFFWSKEKELWDVIQNTDFSARGMIEFRIKFGKTTFQVKVKVREFEISRPKRLKMEMTDLSSEIEINVYVLENGFEFTAPGFDLAGNLYLQKDIFPWGEDGIHLAALAKRLLEELRESDV